MPGPQAPSETLCKALPCAQPRGDDKKLGAGEAEGKQNGREPRLDNRTACRHSEGVRCGRAAQAPEPGGWGEGRQQHRSSKVTVTLDLSNLKCLELADEVICMQT